MKLSRGEKVYVVVMNVLAVICGLICLLPVLNLASKSLSSVKAVSGNSVLFWPVEFTTVGWQYIWVYTSYTRSLMNSVINTLCGTLLSLGITILTAYALAHPELKGRKVIIYLYVVSMVFSAGTLPMYFQLNSYNLLNTRWSLILPHLVSPYYTFVLKSGFESVPDSLEEAARIDGASYTRTLTSIVLPVSKASIATIVIFTAVAYWNRYFDALIYITKQPLKPLSLLLYEVIKLAKMEDTNDEIYGQALSQIIKDASMVIMTILPILLIYPFMQRYFVKGVMVGSVKG
ncbi:MAG: carbohydrate ABC transporter permease [Clostridia bacterium]|nr:carbohydrate ABC transporter permease [Clostridia bacterium]